MDCLRRDSVRLYRTSFVYRSLTCGKRRAAGHWPRPPRGLKLAALCRPSEPDSPWTIRSRQPCLRIIDACRRCAGAGRAQSGLFLSRAARHGAKPGDVVCVPLGPREVVAVVWAENANPDPRLHNRLKDVGEKLDVPPLKPELRSLVDWVAELHAVGARHGAAHDACGWARISAPNGCGWACGWSANRHGA